MIEFLRIEDRGPWLVAVFGRGYRSFVPTDAGHGYYDDGTFCLNESSLLTRVENLKRNGYNTSVWHLALAELRRQQQLNSSDSNSERGLGDER
jgi:hypothetical protein